MPIRIVKDRETASPDNYPGSAGGGNQSGGLKGGCLAALLPLLLRNPKIALVILAIGVAIYFFGGKDFLQLAAGSGDVFSLGADLNQQVYDKAEVFEPLADNSKNPLPERVTLEKYAPSRLNQGSQGSCVAWSGAYAARTILYARQTEKNPDEVAFSPSFLYNQIGLEGCQGSYIIRAMENMNQVGALPLKDFPYNENDCSAQPVQYQLQSAGDYRIKGFNRLSKSGDDYMADMLAVKQNLAQGAPVVIGMMVGGTFMHDMLGKKVWVPSEDDYGKMGFGGHAMCVIGYDDYLEGGAFQLMNSWGSEWGEKGIAWIRYKDFGFFVKEAYGIYPMGTSEKAEKSMLNVEFGLLAYDEANSNINQMTPIPLKYKSGLIYAVAQPIKKGDKFKIEITNSSACYTYIFGQESDGSSYVLFPYTPKHSPYCGITGTRLFPKDYSLQADESGTKDFMGVVISQKPLDFNVLNETINKSRESNYAAKIQDALHAQLDRDIDFVENSGRVRFDTKADPEKVVAFVIEVDKK